MRAVTGVLTLLLSLTALDAVAQETPCCIDDFVSTWVQALEAGDLDAATGHYLPADSLVVVESSGRTHMGKDAARTMYLAAFGELTFDKVSIDPKSTHLEATSGHAYFQLKAQCTVKADKSRLELHVQGTWALQKVDGEWKIVVEHFSPVKDTPRVKVLK